MDWELKYQLLEKYWKGEATIEEEMKLRAIFCKEGLSWDEESLRAYFINLKQFQSIQLDSDFDRVLLSKVIEKPRFFPIKPVWKKGWNIAASVAVLIITALMLQPQQDQNINLTNNIENDPQKAFELTKQSLMLISSKFSQGADYTYGVGKFNKTTDKLKKRNK